MRRALHTVLISLIVLVTCSAARAQQPEFPDNVGLPENASLQDTLSWLDTNLRRYGRFTLYYSLYEPGLRYRTQFQGLDANGCSITYRVSYERLGPGGRDVISPSGQLTSLNDGNVSTRENTVNLALLDPALVRADRPKKWDGARVVFGSQRGKLALSFRDQRGKLRQYEGGEFYVSELDAVDSIARAMRQAVTLCHNKS